MAECEDIAEIPLQIEVVEFGL